MYLLLTTVGVALIVLSTIVTCIVYWELQTKVITGVKAAVSKNNTAASETIVGICIPEINGVKKDTSARPIFFIARRLFYCLVCCVPIAWCLYGAGDLGTRFTYLLREVLNGKFAQAKVEDLTYLNSHFQMRHLAKDSGIVMFNYGIDMEFLRTASSIFLSLCAIIASYVSTS